MSKDGIQILIVDDDAQLCTMLDHLVKKEGFKTEAVHDGASAKRVVRSRVPDLMLLDVMLPDMSGMEVLKEVKELEESLPVIMMTGHGEIRDSVEAIKTGAHDYLTKPFDMHEVIRVVYRALAERDLKRRVKQLSNELKERYPLKEMMGPSDKVARLDLEVNRVAKSDFTVVILGETGSGKELVARAIHQASLRSKGPFVPVDCGAIPEPLLEDDLFGHEKGAFTGADVQRGGKFEISNGGTLFLDEVSNMPLGSQAKLLRVLQEKVAYRVGGTKPINVDIRLLVASNQDLQGLSESGSFRLDLFYRLNEFAIAVPPLRERKEDIPYLAKRFLDSANTELNKSVRELSEAGLEVLFRYNWPGNVRQLRATIRRAVLLADEVITEKHLDLKRVPVPGLAFTPKVDGMPWTNYSFKEILQQSLISVEREVITQALRYTGGNKAKAARMLHIDYKTIHTKVKQLGISVEEKKDHA
jgi:two-component system nitrogen regulation response regulator GlnG